MLTLISSPNLQQKCKSLFLTIFTLSPKNTSKNHLTFLNNTTMALHQKWSFRWNQNIPSYLGNSKTHRKEHGKEKRHKSLSSISSNTNCPSNNTETGITISHSRTLRNMEVQDFFSTIIMTLQSNFCKKWFQITTGSFGSLNALPVIFGPLFILKWRIFHGCVRNFF